jgi:hypothetical protein
MSCLARSDDEATTWPVLQKPDGSPLTVPSGELRVDTDGNLYIVQKTGSSLLLQISRDGGLSWSDPLNMTAPAARSITLGQSAVAVGAPGQVAVSYLAAAQSGTGSDGYITVTHDALKADGTPNPDAVFYAATVNSPDRQLVTQGKGGADDYIAVDVGPDGTPWASFYSDCLQNADGTYQDPGCGETQGQGSTGVPPVPGPAHATTVGHLEF